MSAEEKIREVETGFTKPVDTISDSVELNFEHDTEKNLLKVNR